MISRLLFVSWFVLAFAVFVYSYGFVDFNLTLSSHPVVMAFVGWSQQLALFHRPLSLWVYIALIALLFALYVGTLVGSYVRKLAFFPWKPIIVLALVCSLSYPLLSHDVFKYLFSARMAIDYGLNPHVVSPNLVPGDDLWLRFMRWVHTPSPYGPVMTMLAIPYYLLGLKKFTPTLYLFKLDQAVWYLLSVWLVGKLAGRLKLSKSKIVLAQLFFALNPLVLVEWLVNAHNDAPMIALLLLSLYLLSLSKHLLSFVFLLLSAGIKYVTIVFLPIIFWHKKYHNKPYLLSTIYYLLAAFAAIPYLYHYTTQFQPWYVTWLVPFAALTMNSSLMLLVGAYSLGALLRYLPYIATGLWVGTPLQFALLTYLPLGLAVAILAWRHLALRKL